MPRENPTACTPAVAAAVPLSVTVGRRTFRLRFTDDIRIDGEPFATYVNAADGSLIVSTGGLDPDDPSADLFGRIGEAVVLAWATTGGVDAGSDDVQTWKATGADEGGPT